MTDVSVTLRLPCLCPSGHKHGISIQSSINLGDTLLQITCERKTAKTWFLAMLLIYQSSIVSQILDFIHWTVTIFSFVRGENREYRYGHFSVVIDLTRVRLRLSIVNHDTILFLTRNVCSIIVIGIGPLHDLVTTYGINYAGTEITQWDFQNKGKSGLLVDN